MDEDVTTVEDIDRLAERNLAGQRFLIRRGQGVDYAIWAAVMAYSLFLSNLADLLSLTGGIAATVNLACYVAVVILAVRATSRAARRWNRTMQLQSVLNVRQKKNRMPIILRWLLLIFALFVLTIAFLPSYAYVIFYANLVPLAVGLYYVHRRIFSGSLPIEGVLATSSLFISALLSLTLSIPGAVPGEGAAISIVWTATLVVWFFASLYALFHAPDELGVLSD